MRLSFRSHYLWILVALGAVLALSLVSMYIPGSINSNFSADRPLAVPSEGVIAAASPSTQDFGGVVNITGNSSGSILTYARIYKPDGSLLGNFSMAKGAYNGTFYYSRTYSTVGVYNYTVLAKYADNSWSASSNKHFEIVDMTKPSAPGSLEIKTPITQNRPSFEWSASSDTGSGVRGYAYSIDSPIQNSTSANFTTSTQITLPTVPIFTIPDGLHIFYVKAVDFSGNWGPDSSLQFIIDIPPEVIIIYPRHNWGLEQGWYTIEAEVKDAIGIRNVDFYVDGQLLPNGSLPGRNVISNSSYRVPWNVSSAQGSNHTIQVIAYDISGNSRKSDAITVSVIKGTDYDAILRLVVQTFGNVKELNTYPFPLIQQGMEYNVTVSGISQLKTISFMVNETRVGATLGVATFDGRPSALSPLAVGGDEPSYLLIVLIDASSALEFKTIPVSSINVSFYVNKENAKSKNVDVSTVKLYNSPSMDSGWTELAAHKESEDNETIFYKAHSGHAWMFAISGQKQGVVSMFIMWLGMIPVGFLIGGGVAIALVAAVVLGHRWISAYMAKRRHQAYIVKKKAILASPMTRKETPSNEFYVENLTIVKGGRSIVQNVSFSFAAGKIIAVLGPSGSGKSTILKAVIGENDYAGDLSVLGFDAKKDIAEIKRIIGYVPQDLQLYKNMTVRENIRYFGNQYSINKAESDRRALRISRILGIDHRLNTKVEVLSGGEQRRASIAAALVHNPQLLILDEPTSGLDPITRRTLWRFLKKLNVEFGVSIITTTHFVDEAEYANMVLIVNKGRIVAYDTPENLKLSIPGKGKAVELELYRMSEPTMVRIKDLESELKAKGMIEKADYTGYYVKFYTENPQISAGHIMDMFNKADIGLRTINVVDISLEDVFVYYTGEKFKTKEE
ncbi:MAG: ATP-binding cassette domain-containing protein [Candidatus Thermoplasmatota archaeon]|nr:ATP-binding cassette domain-containing protein [Candidatus Thermoplasmatota archaeon]